MQFTDTELEKFLEAYPLNYGEAINISEAREMFSRLVRFYELISRPLPHSAEDVMQPDTPHLPQENESF